MLKPFLPTCLFALLLPVASAQADFVKITVSGMLSAVTTDDAGVDGATFELVYEHSNGEIWEFDPSGGELFTSVGPTRVLTLTSTPGLANDGVYVGGGRNIRFGDFGSGPRTGVILSGVGWVQTSDTYGLNSGQILDFNQLEFSNGTTPIVENGLVVAENFGNLSLEIQGREPGELPALYGVSGLGVQVVNAIPEPSAFLYGGLISVLAGCGYRIKRRLAVA